MTAAAAATYCCCQNCIGPIAISANNIVEDMSGHTKINFLQQFSQASLQYKFALVIAVRHVNVEI